MGSTSMGFVNFHVPSPEEYILKIFKATFSNYETVSTDQTMPVAMSLSCSIDNSREFLISCNSNATVPDKSWNFKSFTLEHETLQQTKGAGQQAQPATPTTHREEAQESTGKLPRQANSLQRQVKGTVASDQAVRAYTAPSGSPGLFSYSHIAKTQRSFIQGRNKFSDPMERLLSDQPNARGKCSNRFYSSPVTGQAEALTGSFEMLTAFSKGPSVTPFSDAFYLMAIARGFQTPPNDGQESCLESLNSVKSVTEECIQYQGTTVIEPHWSRHTILEEIQTFLFTNSLIPPPLRTLILIGDAGNSRHNKGIGMEVSIAPHFIIILFTEKELQVVNWKLLRLLKDKNKNGTILFLPRLTSTVSFLNMRFSIRALCSDQAAAVSPCEQHENAIVLGKVAVLEGKMQNGKMDLLKGLKMSSDPGFNMQQNLGKSNYEHLKGTGAEWCSVVFRGPSAMTPQPYSPYEQFL
ncbi:hypothetical protein WISP_110553 [Willisornis vidua]|uniref:Uncharacterized protein n=1 Tax=Willisornis vidua TaxID=1566151 RepID=A0ABQ9CVL9_9PASS|nr:hypothetical protein WISP_110553 [Willisornis vidua]